MARGKQVNIAGWKRPVKQAKDGHAATRLPLKHQEQLRVALDQAQRQIADMAAAHGPSAPSRTTCAPRCAM